MNYYERHIGDYLKDTSHLSLIEHGVYTRLLDVYYTRECAIDAADASRLIGARSKDEKAALLIVLADFFVLDGGVYVQARCDREIERYQRKATHNREVGKLGGRPRKSETQTVPKQEPTNNPGGLQTEPTNNPPQYPVTSNQKPEEKTLGSAKRRTRIPPDFFPDETGVEAIERVGLSLAIERVKFIDYHTGKGSVMADWQAAWRTWASNAQNFRPAQTRMSSQAKTINELTGGLASVKEHPHALAIA